MEHPILTAIRRAAFTPLGWFAPSTWISVETGKSEKLEVEGFDIDAERVVGKARLTLLRLAGDVID